MKEKPMQDYYAARATEYDQIYQKPERQADLRRIEQWLPSVFAGRTVLEVACGTGPTREALLASVAPRAERTTYHAWDYFWALEYTLRA